MAYDGKLSYWLRVKTIEKASGLEGSVSVCAVLSLFDPRVISRFVATMNCHSRDGQASTNPRSQYEQNLSFPSPPLCGFRPADRGRSGTEPPLVQDSYVVPGNPTNYGTTGGLLVGVPPTRSPHTVRPYFSAPGTRHRMSVERPWCCSSQNWGGGERKYLGRERRLDGIGRERDQRPVAGAAVASGVAVSAQTATFLWMRPRQFKTGSTEQRTVDS